MLALGLLLAIPQMGNTANPNVQSNAIEHTTHKYIKADQLKSWYDSNKEMVVIDARSTSYFDGTLLPKAKWLAAEASDEEIKATIPSKDSFIVVYCYGVDCPASGWLYDKLIKLGYHHIVEYHEGIQDWISKGYPTNKSK